MTHAELAERLCDARELLPIGSTWRHWKGADYVVMYVSLDEATLQPLVTYRHDGLAFTRTLEEWTETVAISWSADGGVGLWGPRFTRVR